MALFKISKGSKANLPATLTEGFCWYTYDDSKFYIDHKDESGTLVRKALNAQEAEKLIGYDITTILNSSDVEIPTSKTVLDALAQKSQVQVVVDDVSEILQTLKIHKMTQEQYEQGLANGSLEDNAIYLTPDEAIDLSEYATVEQVQSKADAEHTHSTLDLESLSVGGVGIEQLIENIVQKMMDAGRIIEITGGDMNV